MWVIKDLGHQRPRTPAGYPASFEMLVGVIDAQGESVKEGSRLGRRLICLVTAIAARTFEMACLHHRSPPWPFRDEVSSA